jgi:hypothetical protein
VELLLLACMVIAGLVTNGKVASTAYENGKEPPRVAKARMRHEAGGGGKTDRGTPKGKGAFRLMAAKRWEQACRSAMSKADEKARKRGEWLRTTAPLRDKEWFDNQFARLDRAQQQRLKWAIDNGLIDPPPGYESPFGEPDKPESSRAPSRPAAAPPPPRPPIPARGCLWQTPRHWGGGCGHACVDGSVYCPVHKVIARTVMCQWGGGGKCGQPRAQHRPFCDGHLDEWKQRARAYEARTAEASDRPADQPQPTPVSEETPNPAPTPEPEPERPKPADEEWRNPDTELADKAPADGQADDNGAERTDGDVPEPTTPSPREPVAEEGNTQPTEGTSTVYEDAVAQLLAAAQRVEQYANDLGAFADTLAAKGWGDAEITGPLKDLLPRLTELAGELRDLATQIQQQGNNGAEARDGHSYVPEVQHLS